MTDNTNTKMREAFEKWAITKSLDLRKDKDEWQRDRYYHSHVDAMWFARQAAQSVPVVDTVLPIANAYESGIGHCNDNLCNPYKEGSAEAFAYDYGKEFGKARGISQSVPVVGEPVAFLNECLLKLSHPVMPYVSINEPVPDRDWRISPLYKAPTNYIPAAELERLREKLASAERERDQSSARLHEVAVACATAERERDEAHEIIYQYKGMAARYKACMDERDALRKDAERGRMLIEHGEWIRRNHDTDEAHALLAIRLPYGADLSCKATREDAFDAAMQERQ